MNFTKKSDCLDCFFFFFKSNPDENQQDKNQARFNSMTVWNLNWTRVPHSRLKILFSKLPWEDISKELTLYLFSLWGAENWLWKKNKSWTLLWICFYLFKLSQERLGIIQLEKIQTAGLGLVPEVKINSLKVKLCAMSVRPRQNNTAATPNGTIVIIPSRIQHPGN